MKRIVLSISLAGALLSIQIDAVLDQTSLSKVNWDNLIEFDGALNGLAKKITTSDSPEEQAKNEQLLIDTLKNIKMPNKDKFEKVLALLRGELERYSSNSDLFDTLDQFLKKSQYKEDLSTPVKAHARLTNLLKKLEEAPLPRKEIVAAHFIRTFDKVADKKAVLKEKDFKGRNLLRKAGEIRRVPISLLEKLSPYAPEQTWTDYNESILELRYLNKQLLNGTDEDATQSEKEFSKKIENKLIEIFKTINKTLLKKFISSDHIEDFKDFTFLHFYARSGMDSILKTILSNLDDKAKKTLLEDECHENTAFIFAIAKGHHSTALLLLNAGSDPYKKFNGMGALHMIASNCQDEELITTLFNKGVSQQADDEGKTPLDIARDGKNQPFIDLLTKLNNQRLSINLQQLAQTLKALK